MKKGDFMDNIDEVRKVEALARELVKHKIAENMQDAVAQAESMLKGKGKVNIPKSQESGETKAPQEDDVKKLSSQLNQHKNLISEVQSKMNEMIAEINNLRKEINELKGRVNAQNLHMQATAQHHEESKGESQAQASESNKPQESSPKMRGEGAKPEKRTGSYKPGDFKIDQIFYSGSRKK